jgi:hypothetical protein
MVLENGTVVLLPEDRITSAKTSAAVWGSLLAASGGVWALVIWEWIRLT